MPVEINSSLTRRLTPYSGIVDIGTPSITGTVTTLISMLEYGHNGSKDPAAPSKSSRILFVLIKTLSMAARRSRSLLLMLSIRNPTF